MQYSQPPTKQDFSSVTCGAYISLTTKNATPSTFANNT